MHLSHVVDYPMQSQEKDLHMEHSFCLQITIEESLLCTLQGKQHRQSAVVTIMKKGPIVAGGVNL